MAFNETLAARIREILEEESGVREKKMMGGLTFMVNDKMCVGVWKDELLCRIDPEMANIVLEKRGCRPMDVTGRPMKGFFLISEEVLPDRTELDYWIQLALEYNPKAPKAPRKKARPSK